MKLRDRFVSPPLLGALLCSTVPGGNVDDATFAALKRYFDTREITELTITTSAYVSTALFTKALRVAPENDGRTSVQGSC